ncbi:SDR family oxidoreductase [Actinocorallia lasiicapitis]
MTEWTVSDIPPQRGRLAVVTGATGGIGLATATELARAGTDVIIAGRDPAKLDAALAWVRAAAPMAVVRAEPLDLASLASIEAFAGRMIVQGRPVNVLINNAGVMDIPERRLTEDGFELTVGTNHLGHFALTGRMLPLLFAAPAPRVVTVSSLFARMPMIDMTDLLSERSYQPMNAYARSKLANILFALELQRRAGRALTSVAVHPGSARTGLQRYGKGKLRELGNRYLLPYVTQPVEEAAWPSLYAATQQGVYPGGVYVPSGFGELKGPPMLGRIPRAAQDFVLGRDLWRKSEDLTGVRPAFPAVSLVP